MDTGVVSRMQRDTMPKSRRSYLKVVAGIGVASTEGCLGNTDSSETTVTMAASSGASFGKLIVDVIHEEGLDAQNDIQVDVTESDPGNVPQLVINRSVDTGFGNPSGMATARTEGHEVSIFGPWNANHSSLLAPANSDINSWEDALGQQIGLLGAPSGIWNHTVMLLNDQGWDIEEEFETRTGAPAAIRSWITGGDVDAGVLFYPIIVPPLVEGELKEIKFMPDLLKEAFGNVPDFVNLIARDKWLDENPEKAESTQQTLVDAHEYVRENPQECMEQYGPNISIESDEALQLMVKKLPDIASGWDTSEAQTNIREQLELARDLGLISEDAPTDIVADI